MLHVLHRGMVMTGHPAMSAGAADLRRGAVHASDVERRRAGPPGDPWVFELHLSACNRWLACNPPALDEAERTLDILRGIASRLTGSGDTRQVRSECKLRDEAARLQEIAAAMKDLAATIRR